MYTITIDYDQDTDCPTEYGGWEFISFNRRHHNFCDPSEVFCPGFEAKVNEGRAFILSCYEHSGVQWSLKGEGYQCQWDTAQVAGVLIWEDDELPNDPAACARTFLEEYNNWANGQCYYFSIDEDGEDNIDSCGGFIGTEWIVQCLKQEHPELFVLDSLATNVEVAGEASFILDDLPRQTIDNDPLGLDNLL